MKPGPRLGRRHCDSHCTVFLRSLRLFGLAALLAVAKSIKVAGGTSPGKVDLWNRLLLVANVGEEGEGNLCGIRYLCRQPELRVGKTAEPEAITIQKRHANHNGAG